MEKERGKDVKIEIEVRERIFRNQSNRIVMYKTAERDRERKHPTKTTRTRDRFPGPSFSFLPGKPVGAANRRVAMMLGKSERTHKKRTMNPQ